MHFKKVLQSVGVIYGKKVFKVSCNFENYSYLQYINQINRCKHVIVFLTIELELRQAKGYIDKDVIVLTVEDPKSNVGSGGATVNALLTITEYISAQQGHSVRPSLLSYSYFLSFQCNSESGIQKLSMKLSQQNKIHCCASTL